MESKEKTFGRSRVKPCRSRFRIGRCGLEGAMTALHLIPHKSWNVNSAKNRKRASEAREEEERREEDARKREHEWQLETLRRRAGATTTKGREEAIFDASEIQERVDRKTSCEGVPFSTASTKETPWYVQANRDLGAPPVARSGEEQKVKKKHKRTAKSLEEMRRERVEREAKEAERAKRLLRGTSSAEPEGGKRYHAAYGHAAKRRR